MTDHPPLLVVIGPTASGKSALAVSLAQRYGGEVISTDSRQVYTSLSYTTGKITEEEMQGVAHHMLNVVPIGQSYSAHRFAENAKKHVEEIYRRGNIPILAGGTGFYLEALLFKGTISDVPPDPAYRQKLSQQTPEELRQKLQKKDPDAYARIDTRNPRRIMRVLEILRTRGFLPPRTKTPRYRYTMIGITISQKQLHERITERLDERFEHMLPEIQNLLDQGTDPEWLDSLGLECRHITRMFTQNISKEKTYDNLVRATVAYAKRQRTWWRRYPEAQWFYEHEFKKMYRTLDTAYL